jgi:ribose/xylose/arabinose/galactoside ABC-type transport system permease subunit
MNTPSRLLAFLVRCLPLLLAGLIVLATVLLLPAFRRPEYWLRLGRDSFPVAALALALTPIILTGGIDLSVGSVTVLSSVVIGCLWRDLGWPPAWAFAGGVLAGLLAGVGNAALVTVGVVPLVATLATRELFRGLAFTLSGDTPVSLGAAGAPLFKLWEASPLGLPLPLYAVLILFALTWLAVHHTWVGRMVYALGDNEEAARFAAVPVKRIKLGLYAWSGFVAGLCGAADVMRYGAAKAGANPTLDLAAIACVVLGGVRITGGAGHVAGTLVGVVTLTTLLAGLLAVGATWRDTITGALLIAVAVSNEWAGRWRARRGYG